MLKKKSRTEKQNKCIENRNTHTHECTQVMTEHKHIKRKITEREPRKSADIQKRKEQITNRDTECTHREKRK